MRLLFFAFHILSLLCSFNRSCHIVHCLTIFIEKFFILSLKFQSLSVAFDRLILTAVNQSHSKLYNSRIKRVLEGLLRINLQ